MKYEQLLGFQPEDGEGKVARTHRQPAMDTSRVEPNEMSLHDRDDRQGRSSPATSSGVLTSRQPHWTRGVAVGLLTGTLAGCGLPVTSVPTGMTSAPAAASGPVATPVQRPVKQEAARFDRQQGAATKVSPAAVVPTRPTGPATWDGFDPGAAITVLPPNTMNGPDEADDDFDLASSSFQTKWLWGWWGADGLARGLATFAKEEGRVVNWVQYPNGWTALRPQLTVLDAAEGLSLAVGPLVSRTPTSYWNLPWTWRHNTTRHLKFFRRQNVVTLQSRDLRFYAARYLGSPAVFGYVVQAAGGSERYLAYYDNGGRLFGAFGTHGFPAGDTPLPVAD